MLKVNQFSHLRSNQTNKINTSLVGYLFLFLSFLFLSDKALSDDDNIKNSINGSGLSIPRIVSSKNSLTYFRTGPGKEFPIKYELKEKNYPLKIVAEFNNWRKVNTYNNLSGWVHTQLLSSFKSGLIINETFLKRIPSIPSRSKAKLLKGLLINIKECKAKWCKIEVNQNENFQGWVKKEKIWGSIDK